jgi:hypothetical protein
MNAQQLIQQLMLVYSQCRSYQDQGELNTITDPETANERHERIVFRTAFVRPAFFRFEWKKFDPFTNTTGETEAIWSDGNKAYSRNRFEDGVSECESLDHAIASAINVSAHVVSALLMPDQVSFRFMRHGELSLAADELVAGETCAHLSAVITEQRTDIWISKQTFVLKRMREERILKGGNISLPPMPPGISEEERQEMMRVLTEAVEDLRTITDCTYSFAAFDAQIPQSVFQLVG